MIPLRIGLPLSICLLSACGASPFRSAPDVPEYLSRTAIEAGIAEALVPSCPEYQFDNEHKEAEIQSVAARLLADGYTVDQVSDLISAFSDGQAERAALAYFRERDIDDPSDPDETCAALRLEEETGSGIGQYLLPVG